MARSGIEWDDSEIANRLQRWPQAADRALTAIVQRKAPQLQGVMRRSAPWTDRTGNARSGLFGKAVVARGSNYAVVLGHRVPYGIWLEVRFNGRNAIVGPTVQAGGPLVMRDVRGLFDAIFGDLG